MMKKIKHLIFTVLVSLSLSGIQTHLSQAADERFISIIQPNGVKKLMKLNFDQRLSELREMLIGRGADITPDDRISTDMGEISPRDEATFKVSDALKANALSFKLRAPQSKSFMEGEKFSKKPQENPFHIDHLKAISDGMLRVEKVINKNQEALKSLTVLIGPTGAGKTTLINLINNKDSLIATANPKNIEEIVYVVGQDHKGLGKIVAGGIAGTSDLGFYQIKEEKAEEGKWYCDCPGFGDTRGPIQDLLNAYSIYSLFSSVHNVRVVGVCAYKDMQDRKEKFIKILDRMAGVFQESIYQLSPRFNFIRTKVERDIGDEKTLIREIFKSTIEEQDQLFSEGKIDQNRKHLRQYKMDFLNFLLKIPDDQIGFFYQPKRKDVGKTPDDIDRNAILKLYREPEKFTGPVHIDVDAPTQIYIEEFYNFFLSDIEKRVKILCNILPTFINDFTAQYLHPALNLRSDLGELYDFLNYSTKKESLIDKIKNLNSSLEFIFGNSNNESIKRDTKMALEFDIILFASLLEFVHRNLHNIVCSNNDDRLISIDDSFHKLDPTVTGLNSFLQHPHFSWESEGNNRHLITTGYVVGITDIYEEIIDRAQEIIDFDQKIMLTKLDVYCKHSFFLDASIDIPGCDMSVFSHNWKGFPNGIVINLQGGDEEIDVYHHAQGNIHGHPGEPGRNGGCFYGRGRIFHNINADNFIIDVRGGRGRDGHNGTNGAHGRDGINGTAADIRPGINNDRCRVFRQLLQFGDRDYKWPEAIAKLFLTFNGKFREIYLSTFERTRGLPGSDGGMGGSGGYGGLSGNAQVDGLEFYNRIQGDGEEGRNGTPGLPGHGGRHGDIFGAVKLVEYVLPSIRGISEIDDEIADNEHLIQKIRKTIQSIVTTPATIGTTIGSIARTGSVAAVGEAAALSTAAATGIGVGVAAGIIAVQSIGSAISSKLSTKWLDGWEPQKIAPADNVEPTDEERRRLEAFKSELRLVLEKLKASSDEYLDHDIQLVPHRIIDEITLDRFAPNGTVPEQFNEIGRQTPQERTVINVDEKEKYYQDVTADLSTNALLALK